MPTFVIDYLVLKTGFHLFAKMKMPEIIKFKCFLNWETLVCVRVGVGVGLGWC